MFKVSLATLQSALNFSDSEIVAMSCCNIS